MSPSSRCPGNRRPHLHGLCRMPPLSHHPGNRCPHLHGTHHLPILSPHPGRRRAHLQGQRQIVTSSSLMVSPSPWATPLGTVTAQQSPAPSMGDLWTNIKVDPAKMQASLRMVEQGLLQIKASVQHEQQQLALSARLQTSSVVGIQVAARGFLARRRVREMRRQMLEAALVTVDLGTRGRNLALSVGHQQRHRATISKCEHSTCPAGDELQLYDSGGREGTPLVIGKGALFSATIFRYWPPRGCLRWLLLRPIPGARLCAPLSSRWRPWDPGGCTRATPRRRGCPLYLMGSKKIQIRNNKISRDVKGLSSRCLVLGQVDSVFEHPSCCSSRTSWLSRRGVVSGLKEAHGGAAAATTTGPPRGIG
jgi:hypothetical protein